MFLMVSVSLWTVSRSPADISGLRAISSSSSWSLSFSYANRGKHYVRGHYSRDGYSNRGDYSRDGGYSRHDAKEAMIEQAREMMENATTDREREAIRRFMSELGRD